jgi:hypothetical protein
MQEERRLHQAVGLREYVGEEPRPKEEVRQKGLIVLRLRLLKDVEHEIHLVAI